MNAGPASASEPSGGFAGLVARRRTCRSFSDEPVDTQLLLSLLDTARRVPSAGHTQGFDFVLLAGAEATQRYWDATLPAERRASFKFPGLLRAPAIVTVWANPDAYVARYSEPDKAHTELGSSTAAWATPYWLVDASFAAMTLQYAALEAGLGVAFFGMFDHAAAVAGALGVPASRQPVGTVALGWPDGGDTRPGRSAQRARRPLADGPDAQVHVGGW